MTSKSWPRNQPDPVWLTFERKFGKGGATDLGPQYEQLTKKMGYDHRQIVAVTRVKQGSQFAMIGFMAQLVLEGDPNVAQGAAIKAVVTKFESNQNPDFKIDLLGVIKIPGSLAALQTKGGCLVPVADISYLVNSVFSLQNRAAW